MTEKKKMFVATSDRWGERLNILTLEKDGAKSFRFVMGDDNRKSIVGGNNYSTMIRKGDPAVCVSESGAEAAAFLIAKVERRIANLRAQIHRAESDLGQLRGIEKRNPTLNVPEREAEISTAG